MSGEMEPRGLWEQLTHEQARALALESIDTRLEPADAARLGDHLDACPECAAIDAEYRAIHQELHGLAMPAVPRDLWARTSAALDKAESAPAGLSLTRVQQFASRNVALLSTAVAAAVVVVLVASNVILQSPGSAPRPAGASAGIAAVGSGASSHESESPQGPLAVVGGTSYWISEAAGVYEIKGGSDQCPAGQAGCSISGSGQTLGSVKSATPVSAVIAPDASRAAVWTDSKIAVLPLVAKPAMVPLDLLTPRPTGAALATPTATQVPAGTPASDQSPLPTSAPATSAVAPTATETALATSTPVAILSGYEIVGLDPEFSSDGLILAFAARPKDHSTGPDVFVWHVGQEQAHAVTFRHADQLAGWLGDRILISEFSGASASAGRATPGYASYLFDPRAGTAEQIDRPMLLPSADPTGHFLVYWAGTVELDHSSGLWHAAAGDLYFESWSNLSLTPTSLAPVASATDSPTPTPIATAADGAVGPSEAPSYAASAAPTDAGGPLQPSDSTARALVTTDQPGQVRDWIVRWDASGRHAAVWVAEAGSAAIGRLSVFSIDRDAGHADSDQPLPESERVTTGLGFDGGHLSYTTVDGKTYLQDIAALTPATVATPTKGISDQPSEVPTLQSADPSGG
jgi:hypothetical protein